MEALGVFALRMKSSPVQQLCSRCYSNLYRTGAVRRAMQTIAARRQTLSTDTSLKPTNQSSNGSRLTSRSLVMVKGRDACDLLQGLMTNDVQQLNEVKGQKVIYSMFLNNAGRVMYDVMCYHWANDPDGETHSYVLECDSAITQELQKHLKIYRVRKKVDIASLDSEYHVWSIFSPGTTHPAPSPGSNLSHIFADPRVSGLGQRVIIPQGDQVPGIAEVSEEDYTTHRYQWGVAEGVNELPPGECLPLESNLALMNGVSFTKGCYLGQELTARTHHTGVIRKRIMPIQFSSGHARPTIPAGSSIKTVEGKNVGKFRCHLHQNGLALLRTALIGNKLKLTTEDGIEAELEAQRPPWWPHDTNKLKDLQL